MLWKDRNGRMHSTTNLLPQTNTDDFIENTKIVAEKTGNLDLWHEMFGDEEEWWSPLDDNNWTQLRWLMKGFFSPEQHGTWNIMTRDELQSKLIYQMLDDMDLKTMYSVLYDYMSESYDKYSEEELTEEVNEYYPELLTTQD